jgi:hypothetical protein
MTWRARGSILAPLAGLAFLAFGSAGPAAAQTGSPGAAAAEALFRQGKALLDKGQVAEACVKLADSQKLDPAIGTLGLLAFCHEKQKKIATAWQEYLRVAALARDSGQKARERVARQRAADLEKRLPMLRIRVFDPADAQEVSRGGATISRSEWDVAIPVDLGRVEVGARAPGRVSWTGAVEVSAEAATLEVVVPRLDPQVAPIPAPLAPVVAPAGSAPAPLAAAPAGSAPLARDLPAPSDGRTASVVLGWSLVGAGVLGVALGAGFGANAISKNNRSKEHCDAANACDPEGLRLRDDASGSATVSNLAFGLGAAAAAAGVIVLVATPRPAAKSSSSSTRLARATLGLAPARGGFGSLVSAGWSF